MLEWFALGCFAVLFGASVIYANVQLSRERQKLTPAEREKFDEQLRRDIFES